MLTPQLHRIILVTLFVMATGNFAFFQHLIQVYPINPDHISFLLSVTVFFTSATLLFFTLICFGKFGNSVLAIFLLLCSQTAYYMDQYGVIIDSVMLDNVFHTNFQEFSGLVSPTLMARTLFLGILPAWLLIKYPPRMAGFSQELRARLKLVLLLLLLMLIAVAPLTANYATFLRKHKIVRFYANPLFFSSAAVNYARKQFIGGELTTLSRTAQDAVKLGDEGKTKLIILVVGETARADRFSLNGYSRETNPLLKKQGVSSLTRVSSCGTSTGVSLPCMFSALGRARFNLRDAQQQENVLDVLNRHGVEILWRDNNSDSKGVAARVRYEDFKNPANNPVCDNECRDIGMLSGLDRYVETRNHKDILIILHQMGNHGPEYYKRYPKEFERFTPACKTSELSKCSKQEIDNAYDNAILYTDYFLSQAISFLKKYDHQFKTGLLYVSDHGESLGERGIYLHGAPYVFAPKEQTHVPAIVWMGEDFDYSLEQVRPYRDYALSHDDLFCMLLVAFTLESKSCGSAAPILQANRNRHYPAKKF